MSSLTEIADGLKTVVQTITAFDLQVHQVVKRPSTYPAAIIQTPTIPEYGLSLDDRGGQFVIPILLLVGVGEAEKQTSLFPFVDWEGDSSVAAAIQANRSLGLEDVDARVTSVTDPGLVELPDGTVAYGVTVNVNIFAG